MANLGRCTQCEGGLAVKSSYLRAGEVEGRELDGRPKRAISRDANGAAIIKGEVTCLMCGLVQSDHPHQKFMDKKMTEALEAKALKPNPAPQPVVYSQVTHADTQDKRIKALEDKVQGLVENIEFLLSEMTSKAKGKQHAGSSK